MRESKPQGFASRAAIAGSSRIPGPRPKYGSADRCGPHVCDAAKLTLPTLAPFTVTDCAAGRGLVDGHTLGSRSRRVVFRPHSVGGCSAWVALASCRSELVRQDLTSTGDSSLRPQADKRRWQPEPGASLDDGKPMLWGEWQRTHPNAYPRADRLYTAPQELCSSIPTASPHGMDSPTRQEPFDRASQNDSSPLLECTLVRGEQVRH